MSTNNTLSTRSTQSEKARLGAVGENMVVSMLMQNGWNDELLQAMYKKSLNFA